MPSIVFLPQTGADLSLLSPKADQLRLILLSTPVSCQEIILDQQILSFSNHLIPKEDKKFWEELGSNPDPLAPQATARKK